MIRQKHSHFLAHIFSDSFVKAGIYSIWFILLFMGLPLTKPQIYLSKLQKSFCISKNALAPEIAELIFNLFLIIWVFCIKLTISLSPYTATFEASANYLEGIVQNWGTEPYTLGVYSYPKVGTFTTANDSKWRDLQDPVANNRIFFAGEGSHVTHPSTVVGALHEGERAANDVDAINGDPNNPPALPWWWLIHWAELW